VTRSFITKNAIFLIIFTVLVMISEETFAEPGEKTYDTWISKSFSIPPYIPAHDCLTIAADWTKIRSTECGISEAAGFKSVVLGDFVAQIECGGQNLLWLGKELNGAAIGLQADTVGGVIVDIDALTTFSFSGIENQDCTKENHTGMLTYSFDDGFLNIYQKAFPILKKHYQIGTVNIVFDWSFSNQPQHLNIEHLMELQSNGWEVCSHSISHPHLDKIPLLKQEEILTGWTKVPGHMNIYSTSYDFEELPFVLEDRSRLKKKTSIIDVETIPGSYFFDDLNKRVFVHSSDSRHPEFHEMRSDSVERELEWSKMEMNKLGLDVQNFAVPFSVWNSKMANLSKKYYNSAVSGGQNGNSTLFVSPWWLHRMIVITDTTVDDVVSWIKEYVINKRYWLILMFHGIGEDDFSHPWPESKLEQLVSWVDKNSVRVVTQQQGLEIINNSMSCSISPTRFCK
jgi:hypothetical protein